MLVKSTITTDNRNHSHVTYAFVTTFVNTCCIRWESPNAHSGPPLMDAFMNLTVGRTDGISILWTDFIRSLREMGVFFRIILPSSIFLTSSKLFIMEAMKPVQSFMAFTKDRAPSLKSSGIEIRALSIACKGLRSS
jgi:hypothetical protein